MSAIAGLDIALWDLKGRRLGVPVWSLLGGKVRERIQVYVSLVASRFSIHDMYCLYYSYICGMITELGGG